MSSTLKIQYTDRSKRQMSITFHSTDQDEWLIGRRKENFTPDLNLSWDYTVSGRHARVFYDFGGWYIEHLEGKNPTLVNGEALKAGVPYDLPAQATIQLGDSTLLATHDAGDDAPPGEVTPVSSRMDISEAAVPENRRLQILERINESLAQPDEQRLEHLLGVIGNCFANLSSYGIAVYRDKEPYIPASHPRGTAQVSFRMLRRAMATQQLLQWDRAVATESQHVTTLNDAAQALYAPILRGAKKLGVIYLHTKGYFSDDDRALLAEISAILSEHAQFQPESAHLRLPSVFVSYSHKDAEFVRSLVNDLRRQRVRVWFDERLHGGEAWRPQLALAIEQSDAFALVMSPDSLASKEVRWEINEARRAKKRIFPLWHRECDDVPHDLAHIHRINLLTDYQAGVMELAEELYERSGETDELVPKRAMRGVGKGEKVRVLFLAANPLDGARLRLDEEIRTIQERMRGGKYRDQFDMIRQGWAVRFRDLQDHLLEYQPHIVHFSGHGSVTGEIILENNAGESQPVPPQSLKLLFNALNDAADPSKRVQLVILNACYSALQAEAIAEEVGCVLGMERAVSDSAAIEFAGALYSGLTFGRSIQVAFNLSAAAMGLSGEEKTLKLIYQYADANNLVFCEEDDT